jgi:tRNA-splicing ligase RtcB
MGTSSYLLVGTKKAEELTFASIAHGAGRVGSRRWAKENLDKEKSEQRMTEKDI